MAESLPNRKRPHHAVHQALNRPTIVFLTVCTRDRRAILATPAVQLAILSVWDGAQAWVVGRYVVMPDHIHLFATPGKPELPLENWMKFWKRGLSKTLGPGVWQEDHWDSTLRSDESYAEKWQYVVRNPERAGLVKRWEDWPFQGELNELKW